MLSNYIEFNWKDLPLILAFLVLALFIHYKIYRSKQNAVNTLENFSSQSVISFKIHPEKTYTDDFSDAQEFLQNKLLLTDFLQAISDRSPYNPEHDQALSQWGIQILTTSATVRIGCYVPDISPSVVIGFISSETGSGHFQSRSLLRWYQKYGHYWKIGDYQKVQYSRIKPLLMSISFREVTSFKVVSGVSELSQGKNINNFSQDTSLVTEFFESLGDMRFAAPRQKDLNAQWTIHLNAGANSLSIECSIFTENPSVVVGLIDSSAGLTYFQSQQLYHWYQKYSHRWLTPENDRAGALAASTASARIGNAAVSNGPVVLPARAGIERNDAGEAMNGGRSAAGSGTHVLHDDEARGPRTM